MLSTIVSDTDKQVDKKNKGLEMQIETLPIEVGMTTVDELIHEFGEPRFI